MKTQNVLIFSPYWERANGVGGIQQFCQMLTRNLASAYSSRLFFAGGEAHRTNTPLVKTLSGLRSIVRLVSMLLANHPDIIHMNTPFRSSSIARNSLHMMAIKMFRLDRRTLVFFHGWDVQLVEKIIDSFFLRSVFKFIYKRVRFYCVLFEDCRSQLVRLGIDAQKIILITAMYEKLPEQGELKKDPENIQILFMSRFLKEKGVYIAGETIRLLIESGYDHFQSTFAGDGPEFLGFKKYIKTNGLDRYIETPGYVSGEIKQDILRKSDILLFPTHYDEGCPIVILEAMGAGLAIVSTPRARIPDLVENGKNGILVATSDPRDFYDAVKSLIEDRDVLRKMQSANITRARERYEAPIVTKTIEGLYASILNDQNVIPG